MHGPPDGYHVIALGDKKFTVKDRYVDLKLLGTGAQGAVVSAWDKISNGRVAIKKFLTPFANEIYAKRAYREFFYLRLVDHKNVVKLLHAFTPQKRWKEFNEMYLVMELMTANLTRLINSSLTHDHLSYLTYQMLCGVKYLHMGGIIHRDLKPSNIAVDEKCNLKILDFGLARCSAQNSGRVMTRYTVTRYYRAPEIILCGDYSENVDVWSTGCILAELVNNCVLFRGTDEIDQFWKIVEKLGSPAEEFLNRLNKSVARFVRQELRLHSPAENCSELFPPCCFPPDSNTNHTLTTINAVDLLKKLLVMDPMYRISVSEALRHPYLKPWYRDDEVHAELPAKFDQSVDDLNLTVEEWRKRLFSDLNQFQSETENYKLPQ